MIFHYHQKTETVIQRYSVKKALLNLQNLQENICARVSLVAASEQKEDYEKRHSFGINNLFLWFEIMKKE